MPRILILATARMKEATPQQVVALCTRKNIKRKNTDKREVLVAANTGNDQSLPKDQLHSVKLKKKRLLISLQLLKEAKCSHRHVLVD